MALCTWATALTGTKVLLYCDNLAVCYIINSGVSKNEDIMKLIRFMFHVCALHSIECKAVHLSSTDNGIADSLSRLDFVRFHLITCNNQTTQVHPILPYYYKL